MPLEESHERNLVCRWYQWNTEFGKSRHLFFFFLILAVLGKRICTSIVNKRISTEFVQSTFYKHGNVVLKKKKIKPTGKGIFNKNCTAAVLTQVSYFFLKEALTESSKNRCHSPLWTFGGGKRRRSRGSLPRKGSSQAECCWLNSHREVLAEAFWSRHGNCPLCACFCLFFILIFGSLCS